MKYRKRPVVIEAVEVLYAEMLENGPEYWPLAERPDWIIEAVKNGDITLSTKGARDYAVLEIHTAEGVMEANPGDFIIRGVKGELYPIMPDVFARTYEPAPADEACAAL